MSLSQFSRLMLTSILLACAAPVQAADLAQQSRLGAVFAERPVRVIVRGDVETPREAVNEFALKTPGYYGRTTDYEYRSYYGTSPFTIYSRLPYACGFVGLC